MTVDPTNVAEFLLERKDPNRISLRFPKANHSYGELQRRSLQVAQRLMEMGAKKGDRVILISDNSLFWVAAYLGTMRAGLVSVPISTSVSSQEFEYIRRTTDTRIAFVQAEFATRNRDLLRQLSLVTDRVAPDLPEVVSQEAFAALDAVSVAQVPTKVDRDDLAVIMFTSGSTAQPRGVMVSHANIMANTKAIIQYLGLTEADSTMAVLPFHYCFGTSLLHTHLRTGGSLVVDSRFLYPETILQRMIDERCTGFAGVPSHYQILLRGSSLRKKQFPHLRHVQQAGGHLAPSFICQLREALPGTQVFVMYGQTEATARLSYLPPEFLDTKLGSIGKGIPGVTLRVVNDSGIEVLPGEVGEIVAEGESIAMGYWDLPAESATPFRDGKLYTGDLATVDEDGFIYIVDRAKDFLKCGGRRVSCREIEEQVLAFEDVLEAAVIGVPDDVLGEAVKAFVVPRATKFNGLVERLEVFCKCQMHPHLVPKEIVVLRTLPKNSSGKILRQNLRSGRFNNSYGDGTTAVV